LLSKSWLQQQLCCFQVDPMHVAADKRSDLLYRCDVNAQAIRACAHLSRGQRQKSDGEVVFCQRFAIAASPTRRLSTRKAATNFSPVQRAERQRSLLLWSSCAAKSHKVRAAMTLAVCPQHQPISLVSATITLLLRRGCCGRSQGVEHVSHSPMPLQSALQLLLRPKTGQANITITFVMT
jgi:hypothetical protein